jgi:hypothetical protein
MGSDNMDFKFLITTLENKIIEFTMKDITNTSYINVDNVIYISGIPCYYDSIRLKV